MYDHTNTSMFLVPQGDPSPETLHREEYMTRKAAPVEEDAKEADPRQAERASLVRARMLASVGRYFA